MEILDKFQFSQASLEDYRACPRRFKLKYILNLSWPAPEADPVSDYEKYVRRGSLFHCMIEQHIRGVPEEKIFSMVEDKDLILWWNNYLESKLYQGKVFPEVILSTKLKDYSLSARYDLIKIEGDRVIIIDWKTSGKKPDRKELRASFQTKVYLFLLVKCGFYIYNNYQQFLPGNVKMIYWYARFPGDPAEFQYSSSQYKEDEEYLSASIENILKDREFPLTDKKDNCIYCLYKSLCNRGIKAGPLKEFAGEINLPENSFNVEEDMGY